MFSKYVNKDGKELIPISQIAISGGMVGILASMIFTPMEFFKIQIQMKTPQYLKYTGATGIFMGKLKEGKIQHVFRGGLSTMLREGIGGLCYFTVYENYIRLRLK
jgi:solute carrier family 25 carnitine/acylcarnitine transporter 20/29